MRIQKMFFAFILCIAPLLAGGQQLDTPQAQMGSILGTVTDVNGDAVPEATVTIDASTSSDHHTITATDTGFFAFRDLDPALTYSITIHATGFADSTSADIRVNPSQQLDLGAVKLGISVVETSVTAVLPDELATQQVHAAEKQRILGILPNFYTVYDRNPAPLTVKLKFELALRASTDPMTFVGAGFLAGMNQAADTPAYGQGADAYGQRFGAAYASGVSGIMIGGAVLPSLLHQDPRYFYQGEGTTRSRTLHAISAPFVAKGDNGQWQFNYSSIGGDLASAGLSSLYYPSSDRGPGMVVGNVMIATGGRIANALAQEFVLKRFTSHSKEH